MSDNYIYQFIFTTQPQSGQIGLNEIAKLIPMVKFLDWLEAGVGRVQSSINFSEVAKLFREQPPIFIRHICPVHKETKLERNLTDLDKLAEGLKELIPLLDNEKRFSVQSRLLGNNE